MSDLERRGFYRLYWINGSDQIDALASPIRAPCDADAIRQAKVLARGDRVELWHEARLVLHLPATLPPPGSSSGP